MASEASNLRGMTHVALLIGRPTITTGITTHNTPVIALEAALIELRQVQGGSVRHRLA